MKSLKVSKTLVAGMIATMGLAFASSVSAQPATPNGDFTLRGVLTVTNAQANTFVCKVTAFGRQGAFTRDMSTYDGVITALRVQNTDQAPQPAPGVFCGGTPNFPPFGFVHGVRAKFDNPHLDWPYTVDPIAGTITIENVWFGADQSLPFVGCGDPKSPGPGGGTLVLDWTNGDPDFADGNVRWAEIGPGRLNSYSEEYDCEIEGHLKMFFEVGTEY